MKRIEAQAAAVSLGRLAANAALVAGYQLLKADYPELLLPAVQRLSLDRPGNARILQLLGLAARACGEGPLAYSAFQRAAVLAPDDPLIAHSYARTALEAGHPSILLFETARRLAPADGAVLQGLAAAQLAEGQSEAAVELLTDLLEANPLWLDGHRSLAQILGQLGGDAVQSIEAALTRLPLSADLHRLGISILLQARRPEDARNAAAIAQRQWGGQHWLTLRRGHADSEIGDIEAADRAFAALPAPDNAGDVGLLARHALRAGRAAVAAALIEPWLPKDEANLLWPYASLAWRLLDDPRARWLEADGALVGVYDLAGQIGNLAPLAAHLRKLHLVPEAPLDQSVRGGTQTDGNLLLRDEPLIQDLRSVLLDTVAAHLARLPPHRSGHPTLIRRRKPHRVAGAWSVRLKGAGFHADHVHSQGWLSSAFYVALPQSMREGSAQADRAGWLALGESRDLVPTLAPLHLVEPKPGRLVLFPSTMWHGTRPFPAGERLTVAFDIARPRQD